MSGDPREEREALRRALARSRLVTETGAALSSGLDGEESLRRLAHLVVPRMGDACVVDIAENGGVRRLRVAQVTTDGSASHALSVTEHPRPEFTSSVLGRVLDGAGPQLVEDVTAADEPTAQRRLYEETGAVRALVVPLRVRRDVMGALTFLRTASAPEFSEEEVALGAELAHRAALTLDNARLYLLQQRTAEAMQRSLLPVLPDARTTGLGELAARYVPAREYAQVGGDWYDAFQLPDGSMMLAIGDVVGHDLTAAVRMSQLRNMVRALAYDGEDTPAGVMSRTDRVVQGLTDIELVTAMVGRVCGGAACEFRWANAGHPPPLLIHPDGTTGLLEHEPDVALGVDLGVPRTDRLDVLPSGSTLLLYTDGLVERPGEDIGRGFVRLRQQAGPLAGEPLEVFFDEILARMLSEHRDDVALLALRVR
ncbi:PP2C family protein-serine/threonine phosphatase [Streptomyces sp. DT171]|uniref:PP2C family protein-serine/threonine phosphatase n=1 Tax=Streptomyces sp. DT171 TaxID=3416524 RepID=UPI003CE8F6F4